METPAHTTLQAPPGANDSYSISGLLSNFAVIYVNSHKLFTPVTRTERIFTGQENATDSKILVYSILGLHRPN